jgi:putative flippase GtrA
LINSKTSYYIRQRIGEWTVGRLWKFIKFAAVGLLSSGIYAVVVVLSIQYGSIDPRVASIIGYLTALPINFYLQREITFSSDGAIGRQALRFFALHAINMMVATGIMYLSATIMDLPPLVGVATVIMILPLLQFILLDNWVYRKTAPGQSSLEKTEQP